MRNLLIASFMIFISNVAMAACEQSSTDLKKNNSVICNGPEKSSVNFALEAKSSFDMYLSYESLSGCQNSPTYYWEVLDTDGTVTSSSAVSWSDDIHVTAGNSYRLRVDVGNLSDCSYYGLDFGLETF